MASSSGPQENEENCETEEASSANSSSNMSSETHTHATRLKTGSISPKGFASKRRKYKSYKYYSKKTVPSVEETSVLNKSNHCHVQNSSSDVKNEHDVQDSLPSKNEVGATSENEMNGSVSSGSEDSTNVSKSGKCKGGNKDTENPSNSDQTGVKKEKTSEDEEEREDESLNEMSVDDSEEKPSQDLTKETGKDHSTDHTPEHKDSEKLPQSKEVPKTNENKRQTIIVTETKSLAQVINNAVRKDMGTSQEGKPTLVIIETKTPAELGNVPKTQCVTNTITVETGVGKTNSTSLAPISLNSVTVTPSQMKSITTSSNGNAVPLSPSVIEDGGMAVEVPSLVVPYLIEYPPSRTISEFLKMLPLDAKELKEIEEASKNKLYGASNAASSMGSSSNAYNYGNPIGRPKTSDRWGAYFENSLGKFFVDIGLSLAKEWVQTDLVKSQKRKTEKEGKSPQNDLNMDSLIKTLADTKDKNEPFHFPLKKCEYCSFKTESILVMKNHYNYPHEKHLDYRCNYCKFRTRVIQDIRFHMEAEHGLQAKLEKPHCFYHCPLCEFEDNSKAKVTKHSMKCQKKFIPDKNLAPPPEFDPPAKRPKVYPIIPPGMTMQMPTNKYPSIQTYSSKSKITIKPKDSKLSISTQGPYRQLTNSMGNLYYRSSNVVYPQQSVNRSSVAQPSVYLPSNQSLVVNQMLPSSQQYQTNQIYQVVNSPNQFMPVVGGNLGQMGNPRFTILPTPSSNNSSMQGPTPVALVPNIATAAPSRSVLMGNMSSSQRLQTPKPNISITPVTKSSSSVLQSRTRFPLPSTSMSKLSGQNTSSFVVCEICDGYIKDLEQLRTHMQWIHKVKIHPKMIFNRPPLNCQKCQFRFFTDQGLERHLLGAHGLVTSSMQENANKGQDSGRCTICGKVFQWKLLAHMSKDHNMILKPAHLSYKCTVCAATFGMYKLFETHVYQAHSTVAKRVLDTPDEKKVKSPLQIGKTSECKPNLNPPPFILECSECGETFSKKVNYYQHWEKEHLSECYVKLCRIDKCEKCLSAFTGKTPWSVDDESSSEEETPPTDKEIDVGDKTLEPSKSLNCRITDDTENISIKVETNKQEETVLDMDVVEGQDGENDSANLDDEETALDMEVESHDVEHPSPDSVHTDEDDDC